MASPTEDLKFPLGGFHPLLKDLVAAHGLNPDELCVAFPVDEKSRLTTARNEIVVSDGSRTASWRIDSLRDLFRGDRNPPDLEHYPPEYVPFFSFIEKHMTTLAEVLGDPTDEEFMNVFSNLRRRPDGRSLSPLHGAVWQCCAVILGMRPTSQSEFEAVLGRLARSARNFRTHPTSRNYLAYLRGEFG